MSAAPAYPPSRAALIRIQAKLDRWELLHLRDHARELADRLERAEERASDAESWAEHWREQVHAIQEQLSSDLAIGMTADGELSVVSRSTGVAP